MEGCVGTGDAEHASVAQPMTGRQNVQAMDNASLYLMIFFYNFFLGS